MKTQGLFGPVSPPYLTNEQHKKLKDVYEDFLENKSVFSSSAWGSHYILVGLLKSFGIHEDFEAGSQIQNFIEHVLIYNEKPAIY